MNLTSLAQVHCCDKFYSHSYIPVYEELFKGRHPKMLLEIGIGYRDLMLPFVPNYIHGSSLKMWRDYFEEAQIVGIDIRDDVGIHNEDRIRTMTIDQADPFQLLDLIGLIGRPDIIIDDGSHETEHQIISAITLGPYLRRGGIYVIEDVREPDELVREIGGKVMKFDKRPDDCLVVLHKSGVNTC